MLTLTPVTLAAANTFVNAHHRHHKATAGHKFSIGYAKESIMVAVMRKFVLLIPLIYIIPHFWTGDQVSAVYMAEPVADFFAVSFTVFLFRKQFKKALESISGKKDVLNA